MAIEIHLASDKKVDSVMDLIRTKDGHLIDEVSITQFKMVYLGVEVHFEYSRFGIRLDNLTPLVVSPQDFAEVRASCKSKQDIVNTILVKRIFDDGARQFNQRRTTAEADVVADMAFIDGLINDTNQ